MQSQGAGNDGTSRLLAINGPILYLTRGPIVGRIGPMIIVAEIIGGLILAAALINLARSRN